MNDLSDLLATAVGSGYRIDRELAGGGMSRVFVAEEVALGRRVVIKVLPPEMAASVNADRFRREIQLAAQLHHPAIVPLLTAGSTDELLWYVMPLVDGESLRARIVRQGRLSLDDAVRVWRDLLEALEFAHQRNVVHRDIKPENIMMAGRHAVVLDFGVAKAVSAATGTPEGTMGMTRAGMSIGTPAYMAPEQAAADPTVDGRTDLYAAGLVLYEMLAGKRPFDAHTPSEMLAAHLAKAPAPLAIERPDVPPSLAALVMQCLAKRPEDRPASASALLQAVDALAGQLSSARTPDATAAPLAGKGRSRVKWAVAGMLGVVLVAGGGYGLTMWQKVSEMKAMAAVGLADSARMRVMFVPVISDAADSVLARNLSEALRAKLQADRRLFVTADEQVQRAFADLGIMTRPVPADSVRLLAREYSNHVYLQRSIARAGTGYVLSVEARAAENDSTLFQAQETVREASEFPRATSRLAEATHQGLRAVLGKLTRSLPTGTLFGTNAEAARYWVDAQVPFGSGDYLAAAELLRRAVRADSTFAAAWTLLASSLTNFGFNANEAAVARRNSYWFRDRMRSEFGRRWVEAGYLATVGDGAGARAAAQAGLRVAPADLARLFRNTIANSYGREGNADLATPLYEQDHQAQLASPGLATGNLVLVLLDQGRVADVQRVIAQLDSAVGPTHPSTLAARVGLAYGQRNVDTILAIAGLRLANAKTDGARLTALGNLQVGIGLRGQVDSVRVVIAERRRLLSKSGNFGAVVDAAAQDAIARGEFLGDRAGAMKVLDDVQAEVKWDTLPTLDRAYPTLIATRTALGDVATARRMLADWERGVPPELAKVQGRLIAVGRGEIALAEGKGAEALAAFRAGAPLDCPSCAALNYARAFDVMGNADSSVVWYERYLASTSRRAPETSVRFTARAFKRLGELYEAKGDVKQAVQRYTDFITLWKQADPALQPAVEAARARVDKLMAKAG
jgi:tetratricopeptide (TPR) repeat protein